MRYKITILIFVMLIIFLGTSINIAGSDKTLANKNSCRIEQDNRTKEKIYREDLKAFLCGAGYSDSGINMTRTANPFEYPDGIADGTIALNYTISIYHRKISELSFDELSNLLAEIAGIELPIEGSAVSYRFL